MPPLELSRWFLPGQNPIGFGAADFVELTVAALLIGLALTWRPWLEARARKLAENATWSMALLAVLPVALRLTLLANHPVPVPYVSDDFSYFLLADTLRHFRLANPPHPLPQFFETFFVLQEPSYSSIFPLGQGLLLALGWIVFGHPWAGVLLSVAAFCSLCYWMLRAWTTPGWALTGGLLAVILFGPLNQWTNSYWGGAPAATAGCLVFGALPRLRRATRTRDAILLGLGLAIHVLTRPYESCFLFLAAAFFLKPAHWRKLALSAAIVVPALLLTVAQNRAVTGSWMTLPYQVSRYQYGVPAAFTFQPNPTPHRELTPQQKLNYEIQSEVHGPATDTPGSYLARLAGRIRYCRFFFLPPLYLALPFFLPALRERRFVWVALTILTFSFGTNFYPYFYSHYIAAITCLLLLVSVTGLERLSHRSQPAARLIVLLCAAHFLFWYGLHVCGRQFSAPLTEYETWDAINQGDPEGRIAVGNQLAPLPGKHLVFVRYWPRHTFQEWVHNAADIDSSRIIWARDLGPDENEKLRRYYPDRTVWLLEPDARPLRSTVYP